jgi:hypothetical protein
MISARRSAVKEGISAQEELNATSNQAAPGAATMPPTSLIEAAVTTPNQHRRAAATTLSSSTSTRNCNLTCTPPKAELHAMGQRQGKEGSDVDEEGSSTPVGQRTVPQDSSSMDSEACYQSVVSTQKDGLEGR